MSDYIVNNGQLYHHGIKGQRWGRRRYQNTDGSWTAAGRQRYSTSFGGKIANYKVKKANSEVGKAKAALKEAKAAEKQAKKDAANTPEAKTARKEKAVKAAKVGVAVAGVALAAYGAHYVKSKNVEIAAKRGREQAKELFFNEQARINKSMLNAPEHLKTKSLKMDVNDGARRAANNALNDSFAKAAKNVIDYKKTGGKMSELASMSYYELEDVFETYVSRR